MYQAVFPRFEGFDDLSQDHRSPLGLSDLPSWKQRVDAPQKLSDRLHA